MSLQRTDELRPTRHTYALTAESTLEAGHDTTSLLLQGFCVTVPRDHIPQKIKGQHQRIRTWIKRLTRQTILSKSVERHDSVIGLFINRYKFGLSPCYGALPFSNTARSSFLWQSQVLKNQENLSLSREEVEALIEYLETNT